MSVLTRTQNKKHNEFQFRWKFPFRSETRLFKLEKAELSRMLFIPLIISFSTIYPTDIFEPQAPKIEQSTQKI